MVVEGVTRAPVVSHRPIDQKILIVRPKPSSTKAGAANLKAQT